MKQYRTHLVLALIAIAVAGCGYFNTLYNARRQFADAERARMRGETQTARTAYTGSIDKAAKSYRKYPSGRWSDDALYLIARGRFQLGEHVAARAAFRELLSRTNDRAMRGGAFAYAGASEVALAAPAEALVYLDSAAVLLGDDSELAGFVRLWRARSRVMLDDVAGAWRDLDAVTAQDDPDYAAVQLERIALATMVADTTHARLAITALLSSGAARRSLDTLAHLAHAAAARLGAESVRSMLVPHGDWVPAARDSLLLVSAEIAARAGDTLSAHRELSHLMGRSTAAVAAAARITLARSRLRSIGKLEHLSEIRALLLPAIPAGEAYVLINAIRVVDVLVRRSVETGQPIGIFVAAEMARDELNSPELARQLFIAFADVAAQTPWAGKALLAAIALDPQAAEANILRSRLQNMPANPYAALTRGEAVEKAYEVAEERLARSMIALRSEAIQLAQQQESAVVRAVFVLDSIRIAARADAVRAACGLMIDTLTLTGIRADSVRTACLRSDTALVALHLKADTLVWVRGEKPDSAVARRRRTPTTPRDSIK